MTPLRKFGYFIIFINSDNVYDIKNKKLKAAHLKATKLRLDHQSRYALDLINRIILI